MLKNIFITGAGGYIGSRMVEEYLALEYKVIALDRFFFGNVLDDLKTNENLSIVKDDIRFFNKDLLKGVDIVIDLASISNDPSADLNPEVTMNINFSGPVRVAKLAKEMGVKKYIFSSTCSIYGYANTPLNEESSVAPISLYSKSKLLAEKEILKLSDKNFSVTSLRNSTVYGLSRRRMRFDLIINLMTLNAWKDNKIFIFGGGKQWRPLVHIEDCINAFLKIMEERTIEKINGQIFNVGANDQNFQVYQVAEKFEKYFPKLVLEEVPGNLERTDYKVDFSKIKTVINFSTKKTIEDGIVEILYALDKGEIVWDIKTNTLQYYQYLINSDRILSAVKLNGKLF